MPTKRQTVDPIAEYMQEHDRLLVHLSSLNKAARAIHEKGFTEDAHRRALAALKHIKEEVTVHNSSEERALFPVLERYIEGPTMIMRREHRQLRRGYEKLVRGLDRMAKRPKDRRLARELSETAGVFIQQFVNHVHKENHILFPLVQKFLTKDALREVARRMV